MKPLLIITLFLGFSISGYSQLTVGLNTGVNLSNAIYLDNGKEDLVKPFRKIKPGILAGMYLKIGVNEVISVQSDLLFSQKGLKFEQPGYNKVTNSMNYIELPVSGHYHIYNNTYNTLSGFIGGYVSFWLYGNYKYTSLSDGTIDIQKVDFNNPDYKFNRLDIGLLGGLVYSMEKISLYLKYTHSMNGSSELNADALTNRVMSIGLLIDLFSR